ncbi:MAG: 1-acyl-sn-glycerol-3-phosphate acyltransferase [Propionibacteriaceae bacterium]|jgi:1-acyl-sn-glycerol-3-phosphate acyltransferase|nr:1-acyl-sn-glycerol-3-phosphate acyltransferase [Propionibacteriaceae bacterium]
MFYTVVRAIARPLCWILFWPVLKGFDKIHEGPLIVAANHIGTGETFLLPAFAKPQMTFPAKDALFRRDTLFRRMLAWVLTKAHQVPMDRSGGNASAGGMSSLMKCLKAGGVIAIFPEGHRSPDGRLYKGHTGIARLALGADAPILPYACFRTRFTKKWLPFPWLYRPELSMGEEFRFPPEMRDRYLNAATTEEAGAVLREATDEVMRRIQELTGQEMVDEYSLRQRREKKTIEATGHKSTPEPPQTGIEAER